MSSIIDCNYNVANSYVGTYNSAIYECSVTNNPNITTEESVKITGITGAHLSSKSNNDVTGFDIRSKTVHFFPKDIEKFFQNLKMICIFICKLKEIHQSDLKPFANLMYLYLYHNEIEVIEEGLLDFNPNLEVIRIIRGCQIKMFKFRILVT
jgi:hypothetical protein